MVQRFEGTEGTVSGLSPIIKEGVNMWIVSGDQTGNVNEGILKPI